MSTICRALLVVGLSIPASVRAQHTAYPAVILRLPASVKALAMGNVGVVGRDDDVLFYNPAQLATARGTSASAEQFSSTARGGSVSSVSRLNSGGVAVGATVAEFESGPLVYPVERGDMLAAGANIGTSATLAVGVGQVIKGTRIGGTAKYVDERIANTRNGRALLDVGVARDLFSYQMGLAVQNVGRAFSATNPNPELGNVAANGRRVVSRAMPLRTTLGIGRGTQAGPFDIAGTAAVSVLRDGFVTPAGGAELAYTWLDGYTVIVRAGARRADYGEGPMTAGLGLAIDRLTFDYALESLSGSRLAHRIGLRIR